MSKRLLGELLIEEGKIDPDQLKSALAHQKRWGKKIGEAMISLGFISERDLCKTLSKALRIPVIDVSRLDPATINADTLKYIPIQRARSQRIVPLAVKDIRGKKRLVVATSDPTNYKFLDELQFKSGLPLLVMISPDSDIDWYIRRFYLAEENLPKNYVSVVKINKPPEFIESLSSIFDDAEFTNTTQQHRKKTEED
jgi:hypothetical protein